MQIIVQGHGTNVTSAMRDYAFKKIGKIEQFFNNIQKADVVLDARAIDDKTRNQVAEVTLWVAGKKVIRATEAAQDMYAAIDLVCDEVERQVRKHKDKKVKETRRKAKQAKMEERIPDEEFSDGQRVIVDVERFASKPMLPEEAVDRIKVMKQDFLLFLNPESKSVNLAYRKGKEYSIFEPEENGLKSISPNQAADEVETQGKDFMMFSNADTKKVSVLYRRHSGNFGLIESNV